MANGVRHRSNDKFRKEEMDEVTIVVVVGVVVVVVVFDAIIVVRFYQNFMMRIFSLTEINSIFSSSRKCFVVLS